MIFKTITAAINSLINGIFKLLKLTILIMVIALLAVATGALTDSDNYLHNANLAELQLNFSIDSYSSQSLLEQLEEVANNPSIKGVLLSVDSNGGTVSSSMELAAAVKRLAAIKPVVAYAAGNITSGSYYASVWANKIISNPGSIVGSIGVIMTTFDLSSLLDKNGINLKEYKEGRYKGMGSLFNPDSAAQQNRFKTIITKNYNRFVAEVSEARNLPLVDSSNYADGKIFTASEAKKIGLIDDLGYKKDAEQLIAKLSNVEDPKWQRQKDFKRILNDAVSYAGITAIKQLMAAEAQPRL